MHSIFFSVLPLPSNTLRSPSLLRLNIPRELVISAPLFLLRRAQFSFVSSKPLSRFMCRLDGGLWRLCQETSEFPLSDGHHSLVVMAVDPTGRSDPNPVTHTWQVT